MAVDTVAVRGADDIARKLRAIPDALRKQALRTSLAAGARLVRDDARRNAPVLRAPSRYRKPGTVRDAISVRTSKVARRAGNVGVFVNVRPAKGARYRTSTTRFLGVQSRTRVQTRASQRGARSRDDPYYWQWLEFGWTPASSRNTRRSRRKASRAGAARQIPGRRFLRNATRRFPEALRLFEQGAARWFARAEKSGKVQP